MVVPIAVDVFSGCGGMTTGLEQAGFNVMAGVEIDKAAVVAYKTNHPEAVVFGNVQQLTGEEIRRELKLGDRNLDLLAGCSPCQGFSRLRTRNRSTAVNDDRNDLVIEFVRLVEELLPKTIFFENVPGLTSDERFSKMLERLQSKGYNVDWKILNFADFGVPQRRKRLIVVGSRLGSLAIPDNPHLKMDVESAIGQLLKPSESDDILHQLVGTHSPAVLERIKKIPKDGGSRKDLGEDAQLPCHKRIDGYKDIYGRMAWKKPAPTITRFSFNPSKGRYLHPVQDREITLREAALLQTFPPDYKFPVEEFGRGAVASMIGEAVPPRFVKYVAEFIKKHLESLTVP